MKEIFTDQSIRTPVFSHIDRYVNLGFSTHKLSAACLPCKGIFYFLLFLFKTDEEILEAEEKNG